MRVLIVDDEPLARSALESILRSRSDVERFDSAKDSLEALALLEASPYDILLLDIRMPELSGMDLVDRLMKRKSPMPSIIFVTAHDRHAVAAFEKQAVDYVLKPFSSERIHEALNNALRRTECERAARLLKTLPELGTVLSAPSKVAIKAKGRILLVDPSGVAAAEAEGNYVLLEGQSGSYLIRESITTIAEKLESCGFIRIHRSVLVNTSFVEEIEPWSTGEYIVRMKGGKEYTVSRTYKKNLKALARFWIGTNGFANE